MSDWRHRAACADPTIDSELFFPPGDSGPALLQIAVAKSVCRLGLSRANVETQRKRIARKGFRVSDSIQAVL